MGSFTAEERAAIDQAVSEGKVQRIEGPWRDPLDDFTAQRGRLAAARARVAAARTRRSGPAFQLRRPDRDEVAAE